MKIEDIKIGMKVRVNMNITPSYFKSNLFIVSKMGAFDSEVIIKPLESNELYSTYSCYLTPYIEPRQSKRIPLSEMSKDEFDELLKLGYEVEYRRLI